MIKSMIIRGDMCLNIGALEISRDIHKKHEKLFTAQDFLGETVNEILDEYREKIKIKEEEEHDLSLLVATALGKGLKSFQAISRLCLLGYGEEALILLRSSINLLINIAYILSRDNPTECAKDFLAYSYEERVKYLKVAHGIDNLPWKPEMPLEEHKRRVNSWKDVRIADRAKVIPGLHYDKGYRFYSSLEHSDAFALNDYIDDWDEKGPWIGSGANEKYIDLALTHNYMVFTDLLMCVCKYYSIDRPDIFSKLSETLNEAVEE